MPTVLPTVLAIDESPNNQTTSPKNDVSLPTTGDLITALDAAFGNHDWAADVIQTAKKTGLLTGLTNTIDLALTDNSGAALNGLDSGINDLSGTDILLYSDTTNNNIVYGKAGDTVVFVLYLDATGSAVDKGATGADLWLVLFEPVQHYLNTDPTNTTLYNNPDDIVSIIDKISTSVTNPINFSLSGAPSGQSVFMMFGDGTPGIDENGDVDPDEVAIVVTAPNANGTVNTGQGGGGTTLGNFNQMVDPAEALLFTFVQGANPEYTVPNLTAGEAGLEQNIDFRNFFGSESASFTIVQLQPTKMSTLEINALKANTFDPNGTPNDPSDDKPWDQSLYLDHQLENDSVNIESVTLVRSVTVKKVTTVYTVTFNEDGTITGTQKVGNNAATSMTAQQISALGITVTFEANDGDKVTIKGVIAKDNFTYVTSDEHDRVMITNVGDANDANYNSAFDIGGFRIESGGTTTAPLGTIDFYDDGPSITAAPNTQTLTHDETPGVDAGTDVAGSALIVAGGANIASLFAGVAGGDDLDVADNPIGYARSGGALITVAVGGSAGADGPAAQELTYGIQVVDGRFSGVSTTDGTQIFMYNGPGGLVYGRVGTEAGTTDGADPNGDIAFALAVNPLTGEVFVAQYLSLRHPTGGPSYDESIMLAGNAVQQTVTRTDSEGDSATDSNNDVGAQIKFEDDGPNIVAAANSVSVTHDETPGVDAGTDVAGSALIVAGGANIASLFAGVAGGDDLDVADNPIGYARSGSSLLTISVNNAGADGPAAQPLNYSLSVVNGTPSGVSTSEGTQIFMYNGTGGLVYGRVGTEAGATDGADPNGAIAFALAVNQSTGEVYVAQYLSLSHPTGGSSSYDESIQLDAGAVQMSVSLTDKDNDVATDSNNDVGAQIKFEDDGPNIVAASNSVSVTHDETPGVDSTDVLGSVVVGGVTIASRFVGVTGGDDPDVADNPIGYARSGSSLLTISVNNAGADGPAAQPLNYSLSVVNGTPSGVSTSEGTQIFMYNGTGGLVYGRVGTEAGATDGADPNGAIAFALAVNQSTGEVYVAQYLSLSHPTGGSSSYDESIQLDAGAVQMSVSLTDKDNDVATDSNNDVGAQIKFEDDGPNANGTAVNGAVDEDGAPALAGANPGGTDDASDGSAVGPASIAGIFGGGADGAKSYSLSTETSGLPQTLKSQGGDVKYSVSGNVLTAYVEAGGDAMAYDDGVDRKVFTLTLSGTGNSMYTFTLYDQLDHAAPAAGTSFENELTLNLGSILMVADGDNDTATAVAEKLVISVDDDSAVINSSTNIVYSNSLNGAGGIGGTGKFDYSIGVDDRDSYSNTSKDLLVTLTSGSVGTGMFSGISGQTVTWFSETDSQAVYNFSFTYTSNPNTGTTSVASGVLTFDKVNDTYNVVLTNPIQSFSVLTLRDAAADAFKGYVFDSTTSMGGIAGVNTVQLAPSFFVQFKGFAEPSGNGTDGVGINNNGNLDALHLGEPWSSPDDDGFTTEVGPNSELFTLALPQGQTNPAGVSISGTSAGTNSDTMQSGEVLDFTFYAGDPKGLMNPGVAKTTAPTIFIEFDQLSVTFDKNGNVTGGEDMVIVLKLVDPNNPNNTTTRAIIVEAQDIYHAGQTLPSGFGFTSAITGNNGLVIIEQSDYNTGNENWVIQGAQVLASTEGVTGTGLINLSAVDANGEGTSSTSFSTTADSGNASGGTWDSDVFKIVNIGFITNITPDSTLNFSVQAIDYDGDTTASQSLVVKIEADNVFTGTSTADTFVMTDIPVDLDQTLTQETRTLIDYNATTDVLDFQTDATSSNFENGGSFASLAAFISNINTNDQLDGTTQFFYGVVNGTDSYLAYDFDGNGYTSIVKLTGVTSGFTHDDII